MNTNIEIANSQPSLNQITQKIIGETCNQVTFSYGDELLLDFGEMTAYDHPKLRDLRKGTWQLSTRATNFDLRKVHPMFFSSYFKNPMYPTKTRLRLLENKKLTDFVIDSDNFKLTLSFEGNYQLVLKPDLEDDSGLAYWELMMPNEQILTVGPGMFWECKSIHERY
ncbi:hypothetical protein FJR06_23135 [Dolichospermum sp. UHCC 0352]|uniref:hypothetical protein n=1 Tax=Nostocales TaxID=1161 RepID=UPI00029B71A0|nr:MULTISPECIES: hypothetical protein [Nostocales]AFW95519.1 hypothetical protein ANA_C12813 [Anabaena sp. 90]MTJ24049.1 hypothetical protein [Dolichospermum sp. UHCC 0352]